MRLISSILVAGYLTLLVGGATAAVTVIPQGATITATTIDAQNISITAAKEPNLIGLTESDILSERRSSHSGYVGVGYGAGWYITAGGSRSLGHGRGTEENQIETEITAQKTLTLVGREGEFGRP